MVWIPAEPRKEGEGFSCWTVGSHPSVKGEEMYLWISNKKGKHSILLHSYLTNIFTKINKHMGRRKKANLTFEDDSSLLWLKNILILIEVIMSTMQFCKYSLQIFCPDSKYGCIVYSLLFLFYFERIGLLNSI